MTAIGWTPRVVLSAVPCRAAEGAAMQIIKEWSRRAALYAGAWGIWISPAISLLHRDSYVIMFKAGLRTAGAAS